MQTPPLPGVRGLSSAQARELRSLHGPNRLPQAEHQGWGPLLAEVLREPMFVLLLVAAAVYLAVGDRAEGALLGGFAVLTVGLVVMQGRRRERALDALREMAVPQVSVLRDGGWVRLPSVDLVPGDWMAVAEGDRVAADGVLMSASGLSIDEALLTGESWPVAKQGLPAGPPDDAAHRVWAGTLAVGGHGVARVTATGLHTRMGGIGAALSSIELGQTPLQRQLRRLVQGLGVAAALACLTVVLWTGLVHGDWLGGALSALALGMGMLPEEFPMALAVFMAMGAWRLSRLQVLARRPAVIETLGAASVLCVDKTGTLTENRLRLWALQDEGLAWRASSPVREPAQRRTTETATATTTATTAVPAPAQEPPPAPLQALAEAALRASRADGHDPLDRAVHEALAGTMSAAMVGLELVEEQPILPEAPYVVRTWMDAQGQRFTVVKGAPEAVWALCAGRRHSPKGIALDDPLSATADLAACGLRVLGVAHGVSLDRLEWLGLIAFHDPLRPSVAQAVDQARQAGVEVVMLTGDHEQTARSIAQQSGIEVQPGVLEGRAFEAMDAPARQRAAGQVRVYARVAPEQKLLLVRALQDLGHVVAMTGDGVNDAPALKAAHVGIAMGRRGTDVAREAAGLVLMDEDFGRIVQGIEHGRRLYDNLRKVSRYIVSIHVPLAVLALVPLLLGWPPILLPAHVVLVEMVVDPVCSVVFEAAPLRRGLMKSPPRRLADPLLTRETVLTSIGLGGALAVCCLATFSAALSLQSSAGEARTAALLALTAGNLALVFRLSGPHADRAALPRLERMLPLFVSLSVVTVMAIVLSFEPTRGLLGLEIPPWPLASAALFGAAATVIIADGLLGAALRIAMGPGEADRSRSCPAGRSSTSHDPS